MQMYSLRKKRLARLNRISNIHVEKHGLNMWTGPSIIKEKGDQGERAHD